MRIIVPQRFGDHPKTRPPVGLVHTLRGGLVRLGRGILRHRCGLLPDHAAVRATLRRPEEPANNATKRPMGSSWAPEDPGRRSFAKNVWGRAEKVLDRRKRGPVRWGWKEVMVLEGIAHRGRPRNRAVSCFQLATSDLGSGRPQGLRKVPMLSPSSLVLSPASTV
jgi:hypothetical protein